MRRLLLGVGILPMLVGCLPTWIGGKHLGHRARGYGLEERIVDTQGGTMRFWIGGEGPPLLLIHGFGGTGLSTWAAQLPLADHHTLVVPDLYWFGQSISSNEPSIDTHVQSLQELLDALAMSTVDMVGISYGGFVGLQLAHAAPSRVDRVVIVDSPGPFFVMEDVQALLERAQAESVEEIFVPEDADAVKRLFELALADPPRLPRWVCRDLLGSFLSAHPDEQKALLDDLTQRSSSIELESLVLPSQMLVVWGKGDLVFPLARGKEFAAATGARLAVIEQASHSPNIDASVEFNRVVSEYLQSR